MTAQRHLIFSGHNKNGSTHRVFVCDRGFSERVYCKNTTWAPGKISCHPRKAIGSYNQFDSTFMKSRDVCLVNYRHHLAFFRISLELSLMEGEYSEEWLVFSCPLYRTHTTRNLQIDFSLCHCLYSEPFLTLFLKCTKGNVVFFLPIFTGL